MSQDLWPDVIATAPSERAPVVILREQAVALGKKTKNLVEGAVGRGEHQSFGSQDFIYRFWLRAPALEYRVLLFTVEHPIEFYPLSLSVERSGESVIVNDEPAFLDALKAVFSSDDTVRTVQSLIAQSTD